MKLVYTSHGSDTVSLNVIDLLASGEITFDTNGSYNGDDFLAHSLEIFTTGAQSTISITRDLYTITINPGVYCLMSLRNIRNVTISGIDAISINVYKAEKPERLAQLSPTVPRVRKIKYKSYGLFENLKCNYDTASLSWKWDAGNKAPFNTGFISTPVLFVPNSGVRASLAMFSNLLFLYPAQKQMNMYFGTDLGNFLGAGAGYDGTMWNVTAAGVLYFNAPVFSGAIYIAFDFDIPDVAAPATTQQKPGYFNIEEFIL